MQGRNHLSEQCGKSAPLFFTCTEGPLSNVLWYSFCRKQRTIPEKLYKTPQSLPRLPPFWHVGALIRPDNGRAKRPKLMAPLLSGNCAPLRDGAPIF